MQQDVNEVIRLSPDGAITLHATAESNMIRALEDEDLDPRLRPVFAAALLLIATIRGAAQASFTSH